MKTSRRIALLVAAGAVLAQPPSVNEPLIRISVNLVQMDAVVTDRNGRIVADLSPEDFEILQDGKPQPITRFSFISTSGSSVRPVLTGGVAPAVQRGEVKRTVVLAVDDLGIGFSEMHHTREGLRSFMRSLSPGDLVALLRTGSGVGSFQNFTTDHRRILALIDSIKWNPHTRSGLDSMQGQQSRDSRVRTDGMIPTESRARDRADEMATETVNDGATLGTLGALDWAIQGLREMPGRKSIVLISEGFRLFHRDYTPTRMLELVRRLAEQAARSGVVIYGVDPRGVASLSATVEDRGSPVLWRSEDQQRDNFTASRDPLRLLAAETGGLFLGDNNSVDNLLRKALDDQGGFYLLGYDPGDDSFNRAFHKIQVRMKKPGLKVRSRAGFYGVEESRPSTVAPASREQKLLTAIRSPFHSAEIPLKLTGLYSMDDKAGPVVNCLLHVDLRAVRFDADAGGTRKAKVSVLVVGFDGDGLAKEKTFEAYDLAIPPGKWSESMATGMLFAVRYPLTKPGPYHLRAAVHDAASSAVGSASEFLVAPDPKQRRLALSGIVFDKNPALREFRRGRPISYAYQILHPRIAQSMTTQVRLHAEGKVVFETPVVELANPPKPNSPVLTVGGEVTPGPQVGAGDYLFELVVAETNGKRPLRTSQWADLRIVE